MKVAVDTNVLLRAFLDDDESQSKAAVKALKQATIVAVSVVAFCEFVWVVESRYRLTRSTIADAVRALLEAENLVTNRLAVKAGLDMMVGGGDFADGVIASDGASLGGDTFVSFDKQAVELVTRRSGTAQLLR